MSLAFQTITEEAKAYRVRRLAVPGGWIYEIAILDVGSGARLREHILFIPDVTPAQP